MLQLLISPFHDPYLNLSLENAFLENAASGSPKLFLYSDDPSVILGRFQNPWVESDPSALGSIRLVRRQSGGGTVFHDRGNLNFSFIGRQEEFDKTANLTMICRILEGENLKLSINDRHDLIAEHHGESYKVSGSAFRHKKNTAFHHGTLLIHTDKTLLKKAITPAPDRVFIQTGGTASHRSKVINLSELQPHVTLTEMLKTFLAYSKKGKDLAPPEKESFSWEALRLSPLVQNERERLRSEEWLLEKTPPFKQDLRPAFDGDVPPRIIEVRKGMISSAPDQLKALIGLPYGRKETETLLKGRVEQLSNRGGSMDELFRRLIHIIR